MSKEAYQQYQPPPENNVLFLDPKIVAFSQKQSIQYDMAFDRNESLEINNIVSMEEYRRRKEQFLTYIPKQVEKTLGERFNVELSRFEYDINDGQLWGKDMEEPFINSIKRGRDHRRQNGNPIDCLREEAEVIGFEKIQKVLLDAETPIGTMMLSISPKGENGSSYGNNFYDVFILKQTVSGRRYVEARRYASGASVDEYKSLLMPFADIRVDDDEPAASFLANPIPIQNALSPENLHQYLQKNHKSMKEERFAVIDKHCAGLKKKFAESLLKNPDDEQTLKREFNAILNKADEIDRAIDRDGIEAWKNISPILTGKAIAQDILDYGEGDVREVMTGCGTSAGFDVEKKKKGTVYSVAEFGKKWEYHRGDCVVCKKKDLDVGPCKICKKCEKEFDDEEQS